MLAVLLLGTSACAGGNVRATSWTGATLVGDILYVADLEQVVALDTANDAKVVWAFPEDPKEDRLGTFYVTPAVDENHVIVASQIPPAGFFGQPRNVVWALDRETGEELWNFDGAVSEYVEGGSIGDGVFIIGNSDNNVYALDVESGDPKWGDSFETGHRVWATPLIVEDTVYVGSMDRHLYALDRASGRELWSFPAQGAFAGTPALRDGVLYAGAFDNRLYAIDAQSGTELWRFESESKNWFWGSPAVYGDVVYAADVEGNVYAVDAETGTPIWNKSIGEAVRAGMTVAEDGSRLFVGGQDGTLYSLDTVDGHKMWSEESDGQMLSKPLVDESVVYELVLYESYRIRALYVDNGREVWTYSHDVEE